MDLIDRQELIRQIRLQANRSSLGETSCRELTFGEMAGLILEAPTVPVRHGKWGEPFRNIYGDRVFPCSECSYLVLKIENYCPNCGAKMDGD